MGKNKKSSLGRTYQRVYDLLCGRPPHIRPLHFQWLDTIYLYRGLKRVLPSTEGTMVLDVGCGRAPYRGWFKRKAHFIGIDIKEGEGVDHIIDGRSPWPIGDESIDVVLCAQVMEHAEDLQLVLDETRRVLKNSGRVVVSFPFIYNEHGAPHDFRRFSINGARLLWPDWREVGTERQGAIGSTLGALWLNYCEAALNRNIYTRLLKAALIPVWILGCFFVNMGAVFLDLCDFTDRFYSNVLFVAQKINPLENENAGKTSN